MGTSAFDLLVVPVFMVTFGALVAGAAFIGLIKAFNLLVVRLGHLVRIG